MTHFTPWTASTGGASICLAAALLWWLNGRIAGGSGLVGGPRLAPAALGAPKRTTR